MSFWDSSATCDVYTADGARAWRPSPMERLPPYPQIELKREEAVMLLRRYYRDLCENTLDICPPKQSFDRWLLERKALDDGGDPLLPRACQPELSLCLVREITVDIPVKQTVAKSCPEAEHAIHVFCSKSQRLIEARQDKLNELPVEEKEQLLKRLEDGELWLRKHGSSSPLHQMQNYLDDLRLSCCPVLHKLVGDDLRDLSMKLNRKSDELSEELHAQHVRLHASDGEAAPHEWNRSAAGLNAPHQRHPAAGRGWGKGLPRLQEIRWQQARQKYNWSPSPIRSQRYQAPCPTEGKLPTVTVEEMWGMTMVGCGGCQCDINGQYYTKLQRLYSLNNNENNQSLFRSRLFCVLLRYQALFGTLEAINLQGALPVRAFRALHLDFGVSFECFASPLNCYFPFYCSAFPDTDGYFGSRGSFFDFFPLEGSFEANPPFEEEFVLAMAKHLELLLVLSDKKPLSFIVIVPEWRTPPTPGLLQMDKSRFNRAHIVLPARRHKYRSGKQHNHPKADGPVEFSAGHATEIFFLQNEAGYRKWSPTNEKLQRLSDAFSA